MSKTRGKRVAQESKVAVDEFVKDCGIVPKVRFTAGNGCFRKRVRDRYGISGKTASCRKHNRFKVKQTVAKVRGGEF